MNLQPTLENEYLILEPLTKDDFTALYSVASDPLLWEQHPNKNRYKIDVFTVFFEGALESKGAFKIIDKKSKEVIGSTRFYNLDKENNSVLIGYTFYNRKYWGTFYNTSAKKTMLDYAFKHVDKVYFHIGAENIRSQKAIEKIGAKKINQIEIAYHGETEKPNFEYLIEKENWI